MKVFWSWQSDTPGEIGRYFVRESLKAAITELKQTPEITDREEAQLLAEIHLDQDRQGVPGSPDLANLIFEKIKHAVVFVADVTPVGESDKIDPNQKPKRLINPNVAIELGYSLCALGDRALLMVMNEYYGGRLDIPFDLQGKAGPVFFRLSPDANKEAIARAAQTLKGELKRALKAFVDQQAKVIRQQMMFPAAEPKDDPRFRTAGVALGVRIDPRPFGRQDQEIFLAEGPPLGCELCPYRILGNNGLPTN